MKREKVFGVVLLLSLFWLSVLANPIFRQIGISDDVKVVTANGTQVCQFDGEYYQAHEELPTKNPCEYCTCHPPGLACEVIKCEHKEGCRSLQRSGLCCPQYVCDCELNGTIYQNGDRITETPDPCQDCYCVTGDVVCSAILCSAPEDECTTVPVEGRCCPNYECPYKVDQQASKGEESGTSDHMDAEITLAEDVATSDGEETHQTTTQVSVPEDDSKTDDGGIPEPTVTEVSLSESDRKKDENVTVAEVSLSEDEEISDEGSDQTNPQPLVLEDVQNTEIDTTHSPTDDEVTENPETYASDNVTTRNPGYDLEHVDDERYTATPEVLSVTDAYTDASDGEQTTEVSGQVEDVEAGEDKSNGTIEGEIEMVTETSLRKTTKATEEMTTINERDSTTDEDKIASTQTPDKEEYEEKVLTLLLEEKTGQDERNESSSTFDLETSETVTSTVLIDQKEWQTETTTLVNDEPNEVNVVQTRPSEEVLRDSEVSTQKVFEDEEKEAVTESSSVNRIDEQIDHSIRYDEEGVQTTEIPFPYDDVVTTEKSSHNTEREIVNKLYRSDIEELKNKLIIRVRGGSTVPFKEEDVQTTKIETRTDEYELTTTEVSSSDFLDDKEENFETSVFISTSTPVSDSLHREDLTTVENANPTVIPVTLSSEEKKKNKVDDYWINMMESSNNQAKNVTNSQKDDDSEDQETISKREETTTDYLIITENTTRLRLRSDLLFSEENATSEADGVEHRVTTEINEKREEDETTIVPVIGTPRLDTEDLHQYVNEESGDETTELPTQKIVLNKTELTTKIPFESELKVDDVNLEAEMTTQVVVTTTSEGPETIINTAHVKKIDSEDTTTVSPSNATEEESSHNFTNSPKEVEERDEDPPTVIEIRTETTVPQTTEVWNGFEKENEENLRTNDTTETSKPTNASDPFAQDTTEGEDQENNSEKESSQNQLRASDKDDVAVNPPSYTLFPSPARLGKPPRIEQHLSHLAKKFGKLGLRPVLRRRGKQGVKRRRVNHHRYRRQFLKHF